MTLKLITGAVWFLLRHAGAFTLIALTLFFAWTVIYAVLLLLALAFNGGIGSPVVYPLGLLLISAIVSVGAGIFVPACGVGVIVHRSTDWPLLSSLPFVLIAGYFLSYGLYWLFIELVTTHSMPGVTTIIRNYVYYVTAPLAIYWSVTEGFAGAMEKLGKFATQRLSKIL